MIRSFYIYTTFFINKLIINNQTMNGNELITASKRGFTVLGDLITTPVSSSFKLY
jgi:hypothetical protein